jgi:putative transposase
VVQLTAQRLPPRTSLYISELAAELQTDSRAVGAAVVSPAFQRGESESVIEWKSRRDDASMAHTYASNFIHCIFSTKERRPLIAADRKTDLYAYIGGIARSEGFSLVAAGGTADHVHLLFILPATQSLAATVQKLKGSSSHWMGKGFSWQEGYGAFSVSPSQVPVVKAYIQGQERRHRRHSFEEEFTALLRNCGIEYDPQYVFG